RCVRFMDEIAKEPQLAVVERGSHSLIATFPGQPLDSKSSGNTVDICPVGPLLNRDFRFQSRVWFVNKSPAICAGCANGCNVYVESRGNVIYRLLPRRNEEVNQVWMCDEGRLTYHANNEKRVEWARTGKGERAASVGPRIAVERAVELLMPLAGQGGDGVKALVAFRTDGLAADKLARFELLVAIAQNDDAAAAEADVTLPCQSVYEQEGSLVNWYGRLQRTWPSVAAQRGDAAPAWSWA